MATESTQNAAAHAIDFTKYRRPELTENLSSIVSLPGTFKTILTAGAMAVIVVWVTIPTFFFDRVHWTLLIAVFSYASVWAIVGGTLLGLVLAVNGKLENLVQVVDVTFEISEHVTADVADLRGGTKKMPTARQIIFGVYDNVVLPALEGVVRGQSKILGGLLFRIYRWSLGRLIARVLRDAPREEDSSVNDSPPDDGAELETLDTIDDAAQTIRRRIAGVREYLTTKGTTVRRVVVAPLAFIVACATLIAAIPIIALWLMS
jgi:hypothetical protein